MQDEIRYLHLNAGRVRIRLSKGKNRINRSGSVEPLPNIFVTKTMEEWSRFRPKIDVSSNSDVAASLKIFKLEINEPVRSVVGPGNEPESLFEELFIAGEGERTVVRETVFFFGLNEKLLENGVVQVRRAHDESGVVSSNADCHVSRGYIRRCTVG